MKMSRVKKESRIEVMLYIIQYDTSKVLATMINLNSGLSFLVVVSLSYL